MQHELDKLLIEFGISTSHSRQLFTEKATIKEFAKNQEIITEGKKNELEYLLIEGVLHRYNISERGDRVTTGFYLSKSAITPHFARTQNHVSLFNVQTLTHTILAEIPVKDLDLLRYNNPEIRHFGQKVMEAELSGMYLKEIVDRSYKAKDRLQFFRKKFPNLENIIPHHIIASYLGITNVSFSRLRGEIGRE